MPRGITKTVRAEQTPTLPGTVHKVIKRNATEADLARAQTREGAVIYEHVGRDTIGVDVQHAYVLVKFYLDDLKRLVAVLVKATSTSNNQGVKEDDNAPDNEIEESPTQ